MMKLLLVSLVAFFLDITSASRPYVLNWSSQAYGPDGPWQAVELSIGSNGQPVALYPGANWASTILADSICTNTTLSSTCYAARAGTYNSTESTSALASNQSSWSTFYWGVQGGAITGAIGDQVNLGPVSVPNVSFSAIYQTYQTYPNGREYPVSVGYLALGAPGLRNAVSGTNFNMIAAWLYSSAGGDSIPSYSYGMHIGSVDPPIPGSLVLGGYDKSRVLGEVSAQPVSSEAYSSGVLEIVLQDIGLGVATGGSPFSFARKDGLFISSSGNPLPRRVAIDPTKPYMYLPEATCEAITASLPVSFDTGLGLYFWDTSSSDYANITSSASYLSFAFNKDGLSNQNFTIKVPLRLLTLTLQDPLVEHNVTYFPCFFSTDTPVLGRPFLQAAFIGVNWFEGNGTSTWFMAQAPGPALPAADITTINVDDTALGASDGVWEQSWNGYWTPLENDNSTISGSQGGLSTGAKAGIGVGVGVAGLILIVAGVWAIIVRRRRQHEPVIVEESKPVVRGLSELPQVELPKELDNKGTHEMMASSPEPPRYELG